MSKQTFHYYPYMTPRVSIMSNKAITHLALTNTVVLVLCAILFLLFGYEYFLLEPIEKMNTAAGTIRCHHNKTNPTASTKNIYPTASIFIS